jgi:hypothetical protein
MLGRWLRYRPPWSDVVVVASLVAVVCIPVWPGIFTVDSLAILRSARIGTISNWYAPLHAWVWGVVDRLGNPGTVFLLGVSAFVSAVLFMTRQFLSAPAARVVTAVTVLSPPVYGMLGWVGRDIWFATAAVAITGAVWRLQRRSVTPSGRAVLGLVVLAVAAADSRQNGAPFAVLAVGMAALAVARRALPEARKIVRTAVVLFSIAAFWAGLFVMQRAVISERTYPQQGLYIADVVAVSLIEHRPQMDEDVFPSQDIESLRDRLGDRDPGNAIYLEPPMVRFGHTSRINELWMGQWRRMILENPGAYLAWRTKLYLRQIGLTRNVLTPHFQASDQLEGFASDEVTASFGDLLVARNRILGKTEGKPGWGSPLHAPAVYIVGSILAITVLARRSGYRHRGVALVAVLIVMQAVLFFTTPGSEYRLQYYQVVLGIALGSAAVALRGRSFRHSRTDRRDCTLPARKSFDVEGEKIVVERPVYVPKRRSDDPEDSLYPGDD